MQNLPELQNTASVIRCIVEGGNLEIIGTLETVEIENWKWKTETEITEIVQNL